MPFSRKKVAYYMVWVHGFFSRFRGKVRLDNNGPNVVDDFYTARHFQRVSVCYKVLFRAKRRYLTSGARHFLAYINALLIPVIM